MRPRDRAITHAGCILCALLASFHGGDGRTQPYPSKPIRIVAAAPPGGTTDFLARLVGQRFAASFGQQVVIDNRGGAGGNIAAEIAAKAPADGYTLLVVATSHATNVSLYARLGYDPVGDFAPVSQLTSGAYFLVVHPAVPARTLGELIALAKARKGRVTYASSGTGQASHLGMELLKTVARFDAVHVPYKGTGPALIDTAGGQVDSAMSSPVPTLPLLRAQKLRALAVTSLARSKGAPDIPTIDEQGFRGFEVSTWNGLLAPAGTPREIVARLQEEVARLMALPETRQRLTADGSEPVASAAEEFGIFIKAEIAKWAKVVKQSGARVE